jgi:hypothetical protein
MGYQPISQDDDWETDPDYVNHLSEKDQRKGSALIQPGEDAGAIDLKALREQAAAVDAAADRHDHSSKSHKYGSQ